ncbi:FHA domain-containing protein [Herbiconiux solani]|uniref:FHA domain-containing protein n=1 Tax=Herbiconiux solani TaxID=661329 RepID=UPI00082544B4|nr:FHA domain-containing protein [Herbiconiux solani]
MVRFDIDLSFSAEVEGSPDFTGTMTAAGPEIHIEVSDPSRLPGGRRSLADLRVFAAALARRGVIVSLDGPAGCVVRFGAVKATGLGRLLTGSPHIRLGSPSAVWPMIRRSRARSDELRIPAPPATPFPLAPTVARVVRRRVTTTHYTPGSGRPRLIFVIGSGPWDGRPPREFDLLPGRTTIGSGPDADLRLPGLGDVHAEIRHTEDDEYVLYDIEPTGGGVDTGVLGVADGRTAGPAGAGAMGRASGRAPGRVLRTGARIDLGDWKLAYFREEFADHGRPYGGRVGGELSVQKRQAPRPVPPGARRRTTDHPS